MEGAATVRIPLDTAGRGVCETEPLDGCPIEVVGLVLVIEVEGDISSSGKHLLNVDPRSWRIETDAKAYDV